MASTLKINNLDTATGTTITIPTGKVMVGTDGGTFKSPGQIIQTLHNSINTSVVSNSGGAVETGLALSITPKYSNSKILITVAQNIQTSSNSYTQLCIRRGTIASNSLLSIMVTPEGYNNSTDEEINQVPFSWFDSPNTTSATRYFVSMERLAGSANVTAQTSTSGYSVSTMVLQEIAQ